MTIKPTITDWHGCYEGGWKGMIAAEAFAHPAKFSYALICRIVRHGLDQGYWKPGDVIGDPFGGVATGGIVCGYHGLNWVGCELEPRFVELGNKNLEMHGPNWMALKQATSVRLLQGDSRKFSEVIDERQVVPRWLDEAHSARDLHHGTGANGETNQGLGGGLAGAITSPPYADTTNVGEYRDPEKCKAREERYLKAHPELVGKRPSFLPYGSSEGQIGSLKAGSLDGVISSPPYAHNEKSDRRVLDENGQDRDQRRGYEQGQGCFRGSETYGTADGQIGALKSGSLDGVVTSPPWENQEPSHAQGSKFEAKHRELHPTKLAKNRPSIFQHEYGKSDGQIGESAGETYWQAMHAVYSSMHAAMKPGGVAAIVVKDYVKAKARVPLCDQTCTLLESLGFEVFERCRCWLVKERREPSLFGGEHVTTTERKSFFRRLAEKKGSPRIDWEEVI